MKKLESVRNLVQEMIDSYETRLGAVGILVDSIHEMIETFRVRRVELNTELKEKLVFDQSLRRKDYNLMMEEIHLSYEEREMQVKQILKAFLGEQAGMASRLKMLLFSQANGANNGKSHIEDVRASFSEIKAKHEDGEKKIAEMLHGFHEQYEMFDREIGRLLQKNGSLKIKNVKEMINTLTRGEKSRNKNIAVNSELTGKNQKETDHVLII